MTASTGPSAQHRGAARVAVLLSVVLVISFGLGPLAGGSWADWREEPIRDDLPSPAPDRVVLTWKGDPATSQAVTWRTDTTIEEAYAQIVLADASPDFAHRAQRIEAQTVRLDTGESSAHHHSVNFADLQPNTLYAYRVGAGEHWSEWFHFRTASREPERFSFLYFGDAQNAVFSYWSRAIRAAYSDAPEARFMIHAGDLVSNGCRDAEWGEWFRAGGWIFGVMPSIPSPGNHERCREEDTDVWALTPHWQAQFTLPENGVLGLEERCYYVDYQGVRVISLDSNAEIEKQAEWLDGVLAHNPNRWSVITFHHPIFSSAEGRDNKRLRELWKPVFDRYRVDLALQGHDHTYARGRNLPTARSRAEGGTVYIVSISGPKQYKLTCDRWMDRAGENTQLYQVITVTPDTLHYRAMTVARQLYDAFDLVKREGRPNLLVETLPAGLPERTFP